MVTFFFIDAGVDTDPEKVCSNPVSNAQFSTDPVIDPLERRLPGDVACKKQPGGDAVFFKPGEELVPGKSDAWFDQDGESKP